MGSEVVLIIFQLFFLCEELKQLRYELRRAEAHGLWAKLRAFLHYFTTWNNLDITRIASRGMSLGAAMV